MGIVKEEPKTHKPAHKHAATPPNVRKGVGGMGGKSVASELPASPSHVPLIGILVEFSHIASMIWAKRAPFYYWGFTRPKKNKKNTPRVFYIPNAHEKHVFHEIFFFFFLSAPTKKALFYYWGFTRPPPKKLRHAYSTSPTPRKNMFFMKKNFFFSLRP